MSDVHVCHSSDHRGAFIKIYYDQQREFMNNNMNMNAAPPSDAFSQSNLFHNPVTPSMQPYTQSSSVIHHLVTSNLGPGKFGTFGPSSPLNVSIPSLLEHVKSQSTSSAPTKMYTSNNNAENITSNAQGNNKKMKQVAEVKPMRMSYSDVVSKNAMNSDFTSNNQPTTAAANSTNSNSSSGANTISPATIVSKTIKSKVNNNNFDKNRKSPITEMTKKTVKPSTPPSVVKHQNLSANNNSNKKQKPAKDSTLKIPKFTSNRSESGANENVKIITDSERSSTVGSEDDDDDEVYEDDEVRKMIFIAFNY
jgi:hypothetical protein